MTTNAPNGNNGLNRPSSGSSLPKQRGLPSKTKVRRAWAAVGVIVLAIGFLLYKGLGNSLVYFRTASEAVREKAQLGTSVFRLEGVVVPGTIHDTKAGVDFAVKSKNVSVEVHDTANPPQLFQPNIPVVLVGHFSGNIFLSDQIMVKHSANYVAAHPDRVATVNGKKL
ncbi:MAG: cytochrome c maturation protein CcmE [Actinobacteria bacterium]|jgi:cytochrome c-type biogenesis protein CcmE|nr:cytochrome c maturation protein CcmE [Actinomycetota bacterium]